MPVEYCILEPGRNYATEAEKMSLQEALLAWKNVEMEGSRLVRVGNYPSGEALRKKESFGYMYSFEKSPEIHDVVFPVVEILKVKK